MKLQSTLLAIAATVTATGLSIVAGWQRGGWMVERALWVAIGVVLVVAAHLLPALCRTHGWRIRVIGTALWVACMAASCYGHAVFFVMAQKHAGELRAEAVPVVNSHGRDLSVIARDRADIVTRLARSAARRCVEQCPTLRAERTSLAAKLEALDVEKAETTRAEAAQDRAAAERTSAMADPVGGVLTALGLPIAHADLVAGLAFAAVLEGVACFAWLLAIRPHVRPEVALAPVEQPLHTEPVVSAAPVHAVAPTLKSVADTRQALHSTAIDEQDEVIEVKTRAANGLRSTLNTMRQSTGRFQATVAARFKQIAKPSG
jgi:hypothetical protein